ncbi:MAG: hypothetical protein HW394_1361, partial [Acidobacteria bacterium]|nr:hypothetical protein [Acidobacteriota bacterium]
MTPRQMMLFVVALAVILPATAPAQGRPDFSGTWKFVASNQGYRRMRR